MRRSWWSDSLLADPQYPSGLYSEITTFGRRILSGKLKLGALESSEYSRLSVIWIAAGYSYVVDDSWTTAELASQMTSYSAEGDPNLNR